MDTFTLLKFTHIIGFVLIFGGILGIFISEWQTHATHDVQSFVHAARYTLIFRNSFIAPGSIIVIISGIWLVLHLDMGFFEEPWLIAMWGLFAMEFVEANLVARRSNRLTLQWANEALKVGEITPEIRRQAHRPLGTFTHFFDFPISLVMIYCGVARPGWSEIIIGVVLSVAISAALSLTVPRLHLRKAAGGAQLP